VRLTDRARPKGRRACSWWRRAMSPKRSHRAGDEVGRGGRRAPCVIELLAWSAARLRAKSTTRRSPSALHAIVVATADNAGGATMLSSDQGDLRSLARNADNDVRIALVAVSPWRDPVPWDLS
jgi:hypothetical protein